MLLDTKYYSPIVHVGKPINMLYFENEAGDTFVDLRMTPNNASTYLKTLHKHINGFTETNHFYDYMATVQLGLAADGFRPDSFKLAVARDPIERWVGAVNTQKGYYAERMHIRAHKGMITTDAKVLNDYAFWKDSTVREILAEHERSGSYIRKISEFESQYTSNGPIDLYDRVFEMSEIGIMLDFISNLLGIDLSYETDEMFNKSHKSNEDYQSVNFITIDDLTENDKNVIKKLYKLDYLHGWGLEDT